MDFSRCVCLTVFASISLVVLAFSFKSRKIPKRNLPTFLNEDPNLKENELFKNRVKEIVWTGKEAIVRLVDLARYKCNPVYSETTFVDWLRRIVRRRLRSDKEFINRIALRDLRKSHKVLLDSVENAEKLARKLFNETKNAKRIYVVENTLKGSVQAILNMKKYVNYDEMGMSSESQISSPPEALQLISCNNCAREEQPFVDADFGRTELAVATKVSSSDHEVKMSRVREMIPIKQNEIQSLTKELEALKDETPEYFQLQNAVERVQLSYSDIGLNTANSILKSSQQHSGRSRNKRGFSFEDFAEDVILKHMLPMLALKEGLQTDDLQLVRNVKMGMASQSGSTAEIDGLVCVRETRPPSLISCPAQLARSAVFCRVLAVVEVKRNPDDIGEAFCSYQQSLAWLCGMQDLYDPDVWKTKAYPRGHFDRPFLHWNNGEYLVFTQESFAGLSRRPIPPHTTLNTSVNKFVNMGSELFMDGLYFVTLFGRLESVSSKMLNWVLHQVASNEKFDDSLSEQCSDALEALRMAALEKFPQRPSAMDVLTLYQSCALNDQLFVVELSGPTKSLSEDD